MIGASLCAAGCSIQTSGTQAPQAPTPGTQCETMCFTFVKDHMVTAQGGIRTNYLDKPAEKEQATGAEVLSESMGLWMLYMVAIHDEALFQSALGFVQDELDTGRILSYRYSTDVGAYPVNAFIDDARIIRALLLAGETFASGYRDEALTYARRLYDTNVKDGRVYDMYDETLGQTNDFITLCYIDLDTMRRLAQYDQRWAPVTRTMQDIAEKGYLGDTFPLYAGAYQYSTGEYGREDINTVQSLLTVLNLTRADVCPQRTLDYLKDRIEDGALYGAYQQDGTPVNETQSTAIYAICAMIFAAADDGETYAQCIGRMDTLQVTDEDSEVYGAFANADTLELYAFDNLTAMLAYRQE